MRQPRPVRPRRAASRPVERPPAIPKDVLLGVFQLTAKGGLVVPFDAQDGVPLPVAASARHGAQAGDAVVVAVVRGGRGGVAEAKVTEVLGPVEAPGWTCRSSRGGMRCAASFRKRCASRRRR